MAVASCKRWRFKKRLLDKYGWDEETCAAKWTEALNNPQTIRSRDQMGAVVISFLQEVEVGSGRQIMSDKARLHFNISSFAIGTCFSYTKC